MENRNAFKFAFIIVAMLAIVSTGLLMKPNFDKWFSKDQVEITKDIADSTALSTSAATYTYFVDKQKIEPELIGNSIGYPIDFSTGKTAEGSVIYLTDNQGAAWPVWISKDNTLIVSGIPLHSNSWVVQTNTLRADTTARTTNTLDE